PPDLPPLLEGLSPGEERHDCHDDDNAFGEQAHRQPQVVERELHGRRLLRASAGCGPQRPVILKSIGILMSTRTARPCTRAGRNSALTTYVLAGWSKPGLGLEMTLSDGGSARPVVSMIAWTITRP